MKLQKVLFQELEDAPPSSDCPVCGKECRRSWRVVRNAVDVHDGVSGLLKINVGVYHCNMCDRYFRYNPSFLLPGHTYTNRVINIAVASAVEDKMPVSAIPRRLERDLGVRPSESVIRNWVSMAGERALENGQALATDEFSGVLCIDEAYSGKLSLLLAVDPRHSDKLVAFVLKEGSFNSEDVSQFLKKLERAGIVPESVVTDGSPLYPGVVKEVWPKVHHQLCLFHVSQNLADKVKKTLRELRSQIPKRKPEKRKKTPEAMLEKAKLVVCLHQKGLSLRAIAREAG